MLDSPHLVRMARFALMDRSLGCDISGLDDRQVLSTLLRLPLGPRLTPQVSLLFDGAALRWNSTGAKHSWPAVSGRVGYQGKEHQDLVDKGPLPEGRWLVKQGQYQRMPERSWIEKLIHEAGRGTWPGGESAWGQHRVWLEPAPGTDTRKRSGFSIHGGDSPGSAGCIDLTSSISDFVRVFRAHAHDTELTVVYP